jgi:hypothetical protein
LRTAKRHPGYGMSIGQRRGHAPQLVLGLAAQYQQDLQLLGGIGGAHAARARHLRSFAAR